MLGLDCDVFLVTGSLRSPEGWERGLSRLSIHERSHRVNVQCPVVRKVGFDPDLSKVVFYPNPTSDHINVGLQDYAGMTGSVTIYNALGQRMLERDYEEIPMQPLRFDVQSYVSGIYTIAVKVGDRKWVTKQFVVTKL